MSQCDYNLRMPVGRRNFIKLGALGFVGLSMTDLFALQSAHAASESAARAKSVILLWMDGGPPQHETFDPKPDAPSNIKSKFGSIPTNVAGVHFCDLMPNMAKQMDKIAVVRTLSHNEGAHERACHTLLTGWKPIPSQVYPSMGSVISKELGQTGAMPPYVAIPGSGFAFGYGGAGYLQASFNPFSVGGNPSDKNFKVRDVALPGGVTMERLDRRKSLLQSMDSLFRRFDGMPEAASRSTFYQRAYDIISSPEAKKAFNIHEEPDAVKDKYGRTEFGQSCLLARRMVEAGVRFVTVSMGGWDTHSNNFGACKGWLVPPMDQGFAALLQDLHDKRLLDTTLVVWMGEFGRTPQINPLDGRDHWPNTGCAVFAGAGVKGGQVIGESDKDGAEVKARKVTPQDVAATIYTKLGVNWDQEYVTPQGRPTKVLDGGALIRELA
jgi:hypothetical protein